MFDGSTYIFCPRVEPHGANQFKISAEFNRARLRQSLLYFEKVLYVPYAAKLLIPQFSLVDPEVHLLVEQKVVETLADRRVHIRKLSDAFFSQDAVNLYRSLNERYPDRYFVSSVSISQPANADTANAIYCRIEDSLPVPASDVPISDILAFKTENREKLLRFGNHIEMLGLILSANMGDIEKVVKDLEDNLNRLTESLDSAGLYGGNADFSFSRSVDAGLSKILSSGLGHIFGLNEVASSMIASSIRLSFSKGPVVEAGNSFPRNFEYLIDAGKMRIFRRNGIVAEPDDWLPNASDDQNNTVKLVMPPIELPVQVISSNATIVDNIFG